MRQHVDRVQTERTPHVLDVVRQPGQPERGPVGGKLGAAGAAVVEQHESPPGGEAAQVLEILRCPSRTTRDAEQRRAGAHLVHGKPGAVACVDGVDRLAGGFGGHSSVRSTVRADEAPMLWHISSSAADGIAESTVSTISASPPASRRDTCIAAMLTSASPSTRPTTPTTPGRSL